MKNLATLFKFALLTIVLMGATQASAYDFYTGGFYYSIGSNGVTVENKGSFNTYSGDVAIPEKVTYGGTTYNVVGIGYQAFKNCTGLTGVSIPKTVYLLLNESFSGCTKLTSIVLPSSITSIYNDAFVGCTALKSIYVMRKTPASCNTNNFSSSTYTSATLYVPEESLDAYKSTAPWSSFTTIKTTNYDFEKFGIYYKITDASAKTVKVTYRDEDCDNYSGTVNIPSSVTNDGTTYSVTAIGAFAFKGTNAGGHLTGVVIPNTVKTIEHDAFWLQKNMGNVTIPNSVTTIGDYAFCWCANMTSVTIPNSVTSLGRDAFAECFKLASVTIGTGITKIDESCFYDCEKLATVTIPDNVKTIVSHAFGNCITLNTVTLGSGVTSIGSAVFFSCSALKNVFCKALTPPAIEGNTFNTSHYSSVTLTVPYSSKSAYQSAYYWKDFSTINTSAYDFVIGGIYYRKLSSNTVEVTYKDENYNSYSGSITIPKTITVGGTTYKVTAIGQNAFRQCANLTSVRLNDNINTIGSFSFWNCTKMTNVYDMPAGLTKIDGYAFNFCSALKSFTIPDNVTTIGAAAFSACNSLETIVIPDKVTTIGNNAFQGCKALKNLTIGKGLTAISDQLFDGCSALTQVVIPDNVTKIQRLAFDNCTGLTEVLLGCGLKNLAESSFKNCSSLTNVTCVANTPPTMDNSNCFDQSTYSNATLTVPALALNTYKSADWWRFFNTIEAASFDFCVDGIYYKRLSSNTVEVTYRDLMTATYSGSITIPQSFKVNNVSYKVKAIGAYAFYICKDVTSVSLPNTIVEIKECAFNKCSGLTAITIPNSVTTLGLSVFSECTGLKNVDIPNSVTTIGDIAFNNCTGMKTLTLGSGVKTLGDKAFYGCNALTTVSCAATTPPTMKTSNCFGTTTYNNATLNVPRASVNAYKSADWWRKFNTIVGTNIGSNPYDVDGDGEVGINDVNALIDAILSGDKDSRYDVNSDGEVGLNDVNTLIDYILND